ncbi:DUF6777 domain-containing protein [Streptomyces sp. NPDC026673]|uniref:DUF6777 domain-containing protein n=1 Tax=Streptomyces sp. NPDC026673 TaxID=3155724 RepID=UPI0033FE1B44
MTSPPPQEPSGAPGPGPDPRQPAHARRPWWKSSAGLSALAALGAAVLVLAVFLATRDGGGGGTAAPEGSPSPGRARIVLQPAEAAGPDAFTSGTVRESPPANAPTPSLSPAPSAAYGAPSVSGATRALYGGTKGKSACDVGGQTDLLTGTPAKAAAFARVAGIDADGIGRYLKSLTPALLRADTRVTDHGFDNGSATSFAAVLEAGTAVLVDDRGVPRVRCASGDPLSVPKAAEGAGHTGPAWPGFRASEVVAVRPAARTHRSFVLYDAEREALFRRPAGTRGTADSWVS